MDRLAIGQRDDSKEAGYVLSRPRDLSPEANASIRLLLAAHWVSEDMSTPFPINLGPLASDLLLKVARRLQQAAPVDTRAAEAVTSRIRSATAPLNSRRRAGCWEKKLRMGSFK